MVFYHKPIMNGDRGPRCFRNKMYTHLMADTDEELIEFAVKKLRMKKDWFQAHPRLPHFDVTGIALKKLLAMSQSEAFQFETQAECFKRKYSKFGA